jgi:broad specificity phosphatase PhoE
MDHGRPGHRAGAAVLLLPLIRHIAANRPAVAAGRYLPAAAMRRRLLCLLPATLLPALLPSARAADTPWPLLAQGGRIVLLRHAATVPGIGDPPGFKPGVCSTQRNLSDAGRRDAARIGAAFQQHGVPVAAVLASHWCRCLDTARIAFGRVEPAAMLDSMFRDDEDARERKLAALRAYLAGAGKVDLGRGNVVFVTHDVNIRALGAGYVGQGDLVVARPTADGGLRVEGTFSVAGL